MRTTGILRGMPNIKETAERLLQSSLDIGWAGGQDLRCGNPTTLEQKLASISPFQDYYQSFSGLTNYSTFI